MPLPFSSISGPANAIDYKKVTEQRATAAPLEFEARDAESWHVSKSALDIIATYLQTHNATNVNIIADTAAQLDQVSPAKRTLNDGEEAQETISFLLEFWEVVVISARQIPYQHPAQANLVQLVKALKATSDLEAEPSIWKDVADLENVLQEAWRGVNLNAATAHLLAADVMPWFYFGFWTLRGTFEEAKDNTPRDERRPLASAVFDQDRVVDYDQWLFWKKKFEELGTSDTEASKEAAAAAKITENEGG
ncbi:hypothetical protein Sste5344_000803 [Sporothrix stenoceras]